MADTLLTYAVQTNQDPIQASPQTGDKSSLTLMIVISNDTHKIIDCQSLSFGFLKGTDAKDLFPDATGIGTSVPKGWSIKQDGSLFTATPDPSKDGHNGKIGRDGLTFVLSNIKVNEQPGTTDMTITEVTTNHTGTLSYPLEKFPPQFKIGPLTAQPLIVNEGSSTTLFWNGTGGGTYELMYADADGNTVTIMHPKGEPDQPLPANGSYTIDKLEVTPVMTFYLLITLYVPGQQEPLKAQRQCTVTVKPPQPAINSFTIKANPITPGQPFSFTLKWDIVGAFQITANDGQGGQERTLPIPNNATSYQVFPTQLITNYTLTVFPQGTTRDEENHDKK
ncbi:MAG TPA: hypothetical protein VGC66_01425 [Pyrinomonadaceae bacterium]|jgi:hypothetical protein